MSHFNCVCGYVIVDITDYLPDKAYLLPDEDTETSLDSVVNLLAEFVEAREQGKQDDFLARHEPWLESNDLRKLIRNIFSHPTFSVGRIMYECEHCGRIWIQARPHVNEYVPYQSDVPVRGILRHEGVDISRTSGAE